MMMESPPSAEGCYGGQAARRKKTSGPFRIFPLLRQPTLRRLLPGGKDARPLRQARMPAATSEIGIKTVAVF